MKKGIPAAVFVVTGLVGTQQMQIHDKLYLLLKSAFSNAKQTPRQVVHLLQRRGHRRCQNGNDRPDAPNPFQSWLRCSMMCPKSKSIA